MDAQLFLLCVLTFVIHLIGALAYAVRIAGVRTRRIAMSFALFNVLVLLSRASNAFQGPFLSKRIERELLAGTGQNLLADFQWLSANPPSVAPWSGSPAAAWPARCWPNCCWSRRRAASCSSPA